MYAIIETGGKQYKVQEGDVLNVELLHAEAGDSVVIDKVLMVNKDGQLSVGAPYVNGAKVTLKVEGNGKAKKVVIYKFKAKKNYRRKKWKCAKTLAILIFIKKTGKLLNFIKKLKNRAFLCKIGYFL